MKKGIFIAAGVVALLAVMVWADHKFPAAGVPSAERARQTDRCPDRHPEGPERQGRHPPAVQGPGGPGEFLGDLVRALQSGNPVDDRIPAKVQPARLHHPGSFHGRRRQESHRTLPRKRTLRRERPKRGDELSRSCSATTPSRKNSAESWACPPACSSPATARRSGPSSAWSITTIFPRPSRACCRLSLLESSVRS